MIQIKDANSNTVNLTTTTLPNGEVPVHASLPHTHAAAYAHRVYCAGHRADGLTAAAPLDVYVVPDNAPAWLQIELSAGNPVSTMLYSGASATYGTPATEWRANQTGSGNSGFVFAPNPTINTLGTLVLDYNPPVLSAPPGIILAPGTNYLYRFTPSVDNTSLYVLFTVTFYDWPQ